MADFFVFFVYLNFVFSSLYRKSIREPGIPSAATASVIGNNASMMSGSMASASSSYRRAGDHKNVNMTTNVEAGTTINENLATVGGDIKPRSLRFTWSMKTTSSMDPADMMKEIRKVSYFLTEFQKRIPVIFLLGSRY